MTIVKNQNKNISLNKSLNNIKNIELPKKNLDEKKNKNKLEQININHQGYIIDLLVNISERKDSQKTANTNICQNQPLILDYDLKDIKKFDELNDSFSDISDFDLEKDKNDVNSSFNSSDEDENDEFEEEKIICKNKRRFSEKKFGYDNEYEIEVEKDYEEIIKNLIINK